METNPIIDDLEAIAGMDWNQEQKAFYKQRAADARPVQCVRMRDAFTPEQMVIIREHYKTQKKMCYKNAAEFVSMIANPIGGLFFPEPIWYVEGYVDSCGLLPIEHAFVKYGDKYIDPTFERALHLDVRKQVYASCIELEPVTMNQYQAETGFYGELYVYDYMCKNRPILAEHIRERNLHNRR